MRALILAAAFVAAVGSTAFAEGQGHGGGHAGIHGGMHGGRSAGFNHGYRGGYGGGRGRPFYGTGWCVYHPLAPQCIF